MSNELLRPLLSIEKTKTDLFGREKVALSSPQFTYQNEYNKGEYQWVEKVVGTGSATHSPTDATVDLEVSAASDSIIRQTRRYMRYFSGKTLRATLTFRAGEMLAGATFRVGYFDAHNGVFFKKTSEGCFLVLRSGGVDSEVAQSNWNADSLDGNGASREFINFDKVQIFQINLQWLGVGNVQCMFEEPGGQLIPAHVFENVGLIDTTYMRTANLPIRYELVADETFTGEQSVKQICSEVSIEDGGCGTISSYSHSAGNGITAKAVTSRAVVMAIRPKAEFNSIANRASIIPGGIDIVTGTNNCYWELVWNPVFAGTPTWASVGDHSTVEVTTNATTITGGIVIASGYGVSGSGNSQTAVARNLNTNYPLAIDVDGANPTSLALVATAFTGTSNVNAAMTWEEIY